jgi:hypothetical protein
MRIVRSAPRQGYAANPCRQLNRPPAVLAAAMNEHLVCRAQVVLLAALGLFFGCWPLHPMRT